MSGAKKNWVVSTEIPEAEKISEELKVHPAIVSILLRRGLKSASEIFRFLNPSLDSLESPFAFQEMEKSVARIRLAVERHEKILIYGDYDVDGITGSAILYPVLKKIGADVEAYIPHRIHEGYGLNQDSLAKLLKKKFKLLITVDNGITGVKQIEFLNSQGVDTIIVDHHLPKDSIPPAFAIVTAAFQRPDSTSTGPAARDPRKCEAPASYLRVMPLLASPVEMESGRCTQGDPNLAACGLAFKLAWALLGDFKEVEEYLDLVTIGTIADLAPVLGDNRVLLKFGLPMLSKTKRPGLKALMNTAGLSPAHLNTRDIAFGLGPRINASGRMGSPENAFKLLTTDNELLARNLAQILEEGNRDRQRVEATAYEEALERVELDFAEEHHKVLVLESQDWHEGVLGIVASRLVERYQKPSVIISVRNGIGKGSGRSIPSLSLFDSILKCEDLLVNFGGHAQACGLTIQKENIPHFRNRLNEALSNHAPSEFLPALTIEAELRLDELGPPFLEALERLGPYGPGHRKPLFLSRRVRPRGAVKKRGKDTLQCWMSDETGQTTCEVVGFRKFERWNRSQTTGPCDIVYEPTLKVWNGIATIQLELEDWRPASKSVSAPL